MKSNQFKKYMLYALGEIVLVVIGILIALQINNWNEVKKDRAFGIVMLKGVKKDLNESNFIFNIFLDRLSIIDSTMLELATVSRKSDVSIDSILPLLDYLGWSINFDYPKGGYETLKSLGMDKITNDSLRGVLLNVYDFRLPFFKDLIDAQGEGIRRNGGWGKFFTSKKEAVINLETSEYPYSPISDTLFRNEDFLKFVSVKQEYAKICRSRLNRAIGEIKRVEDLVDRELLTNN